MQSMARFSSPFSRSSSDSRPLSLAVLSVVAVLAVPRLRSRSGLVGPLEQIFSALLLLPLRQRFGLEQMTLILRRPQHRPISKTAVFKLHKWTCQALNRADFTDWERNVLKNVVLIVDTTAPL